jgi:hypothetical protein
MVLDASAVLELLLGTPAGVEVRSHIADAAIALHVPQRLDVEVTQVPVLRAAALYTRVMRSVADDLRRQTVAHVLTLPVPARVELALSLGDDDLEVFVRTSGLDRDEARRRLRAQRQVGRARSVAGTPPRP